jgi:hypothetical protein
MQDLFSEIMKHCQEQSEKTYLLATGTVATKPKMAVFL